MFRPPSSVAICLIALRYPALHPDDIEALKTKFGFAPDQKFQVPQATYDFYGEFGKCGAVLEARWNTLCQKYPKEHAELTRRTAGQLPQGWEHKLPVYKTTDAAQASRKLSEIVLSSIIPVLPEIMGGLADLTGSNLTKVKNSSLLALALEITPVYILDMTFVSMEREPSPMAWRKSGGIILFVATFLVKI